MIGIIADRYMQLLIRQRDGVGLAADILKRPEPPTLLSMLIDAVGSYALVAVSGWAGGFVKGRIGALLRGRPGLTPGRAEASATVVASLMKEGVTDAVGGAWNEVASKHAGERRDPLEALIEMQRTSLTFAATIAATHFRNHGARALRASEDGLAIAEAQLAALDELFCGPLDLRQQNETIDAWVRYVAARSQAKDDGEVTQYSAEGVSPAASNDGVLKVFVDAGSPLHGPLKLLGLDLPGVNPSVLGSYRGRGLVADLNVPKVVEIQGHYFSHEARSRGPRSAEGIPFLGSLLRDKSGGVRIEGFDGPGKAWLKLFFHGRGPAPESRTGDAFFLASLPEAYVEKGARKLFHHVMQIRP